MQLGGTQPNFTISLESLTGKLHISHLENTNTASSACLKEKERLEKLVLQWSDGSINLQDPRIQETVLEELEPHSNLKVLQLRGYKGHTLPAWFSNTSFESLTEVTLSSCVDIEILNLAPLPHLQKVHLKAMRNLKEWAGMVSQSLNWLLISRCPKLRKLPNFFPNLRVMKIKKCDELKDVPATASLMYLVLIENNKLENWNETVNKIQKRTEQGGTTIKYSSSYINLLELPESKRFTRCIRSTKKISGCPLVQALPPQNYSGHLQQLALEGCTDATLVEAIISTSSTYSLVISNIANLISLPVSLSLSGCADLESLSNDDGAAPLSGFTALTLLSICGCPKLTVITGGLLPSSVEYLIIKNCLILGSFGPQNCLVELSALRDVHLEDCPQISSLLDGGLPTSLKGSVMEVNMMEC
ncbi:LOW QUALITY PROTEIN: hypothetical protein V2J09_011705 [Rumex salicifolius]